MRVDGTHYRSIWFNQATAEVGIIDQRWLPNEFRTAALKTLEQFATAIRDMWVRGAPLIGATAAYGVAMEMANDPSDRALDDVWHVLNETRPTAINLRWALDRCRNHLAQLTPDARPAAALQLAHDIAEEDVETNRMLGVHGLSLINDIAARKPSGEPVRILTHCNAGWLATVDWGTATSPIYHAVDAGIDVYVYADETRPRNQGGITAWELGSHGVPHAYIVDNAGGHLMQHGMIDLVIVGTDRTAANGDVCNKIGTYLKALAANDNGVPFYVALPSSTIDWSIHNGVLEIPIEERPKEEVSTVQGKSQDGQIATIGITPAFSEICNPAFDVTPGRLITGLITERGICEASTAGLAGLFPERAK
jgi:methylthioribose-1-phosphate isomerase